MTPEILAQIHAAAFTHLRPWSADEFSALLASPHVFLTGNERAFALGRIIVDEAELLTLATHPAHRRQGLGVACLADFEGTAQARGAMQAFLEVDRENNAALTLYRRNGYKEAGQRPAYYRRLDGRMADALVLTRKFDQQLQIKTC